MNELEVDLQTGSFILRQSDLFVPGRYPIVLTQTYRSFARYNGPFGMGANHSYEIWPTGTRNPYTEMNLNLEDGSQIYYSRISAGTSYDDAIYRHDQTSSEFYGSQFFWNDKRWGWTLRLADLRKILFPEAYNAKAIAQCAPAEMDDEKGNRLLLQRERDRKLHAILSPDRHKIMFRYNESGQIVEAQDDQGRSRSYKYESTSHVGTVLDKGQPLYTFSYERLLDMPEADSFAMTEIRNGIGNRILSLAYDNSGRVIAMTLPDGKVIRFSYGYVNQHGMTKQATTVQLGDGTRRSFFLE